MTRNEAVLKAKAVLACAFEVAPDLIPEDASIESFEPWNSLGHIKVILAIENALERELETDETVTVFDLKTIADLLLASDG